MSRNPFFMFAIYDMQDEFAGIQKIYATLGMQAGQDDEQGLQFKHPLSQSRNR
ncbi:hypothetical protein P4S73_02520 [Paraglaciecola sp. Hal342]